MRAQAEGTSISRYLVSRALTVELAGKDQADRERSPRLVLSETEQAQILDWTREISVRMEAFPEGGWRTLSSQVEAIAAGVENDMVARQMAEDEVGGRVEAVIEGGIRTLSSQVEAIAAGVENDKDGAGGAGIGAPAVFGEQEGDQDVVVVDTTRERVPSMSEKRKAERSGRTFIPKTLAARKRELAKVARRRERMQREVAAARKKEVAIAAAVRIAEKERRARLERSVGALMMTAIGEWRREADAGDAHAQRRLEYWMIELDRLVADPETREFIGLPALPEADR